MLRRIGEGTKRKLREESGATIMVAYVVFLPIFLLALVMLFELTKIQSLKNTNDCITMISANAASRQVIYQQSLGAIQINGSSSLPSSDFTDGSVWGTTASPALPLSGYMSDSHVSPQVKAIFEAPPSMPTTTYDGLSAESIASALYVYNATRNGLSSPDSNGTEIMDSATGGSGAIINNTAPTVYYDTVAGRNFTVNLPSVFFSTQVRYTVNPIFQFATGNLIQDIYLSSSSVAQIVSSPSDDADRQ
jgi:hypothetical protein